MNEFVYLWRRPQRPPQTPQQMQEWMRQTMDWIGGIKFALSELAVNVSGHTVTAKATVRNSGDRAGTAVPQFYLTGPSGANILRLVGWDRVDLQPGEHRQVAASIDPRLLATFDEGARRWRIPAGAYQVSVGFESKHRGSNATFELQPASLPP